MTQVYELDILSTNNWENFFIHKVQNRILRGLKPSDIARVSIRMKGDISGFRVEEIREPGGFVYFLNDSCIKTTLEVMICTKDNYFLPADCKIELPIKTGRKRTAKALSDEIVKEIVRFKKAFESSGKSPVHFVEPKLGEDMMFYFGDSGLALMLQHLEKLDKPAVTLEFLLHQLTLDSIAPQNQRGQRIVKRFLNEKVITQLELPKPKFVNKVPVFSFKSKAMELYLAPTFAVAKKGESLAVLYNIDKGNSVVEAAAVLKQLNFKQAKAIAHLMDLRRGEHVQ